jgi:polysaccharide biosynthesis protein PslH
VRILIATQCLPWPLNTGGNAAQFSTLKCLAEDHQFTLVCPVKNVAGLAHAQTLQAELPSVKVRAIFCAEPRPKFSVRVAKSVIGFGRRVLNPPVSSSTEKPDGSDDLHYPFDALPKLFLTALHEELSRGVDLCQAEFAEMLSLGAWFPKDLPKLFVHHQIHHVYATRFLDTHGRNGHVNYLEKIMQTQEAAYLQNFQGVITFSEQDRQALLPWMASEKIFASPFPIPADVGIADELPTAFDGRFLFVASEEHPPNRDALEWLLAKIWPEVSRRLPSARLVVVGNWSEAAKSRLTSPTVNFSGFVDDLPATLRGGILLVPLRIGSGIRVKIMVAMAQGVPVVSTTVGCEGMPVENGKNLLVRDEPSEFIAAAVDLAKNPELWRRLAMAGKDAISKNYSPEEVRRRRNQIYATLTQVVQKPASMAKI